MSQEEFCRKIPRKSLECSKRYNISEYLHMNILYILLNVTLYIFYIKISPQFRSHIQKHSTVFYTTSKFTDWKFRWEEELHLFSKLEQTSGAGQAHINESHFTWICQTFPIEQNDHFINFSLDFGMYVAQQNSALD